MDSKNILSHRTVDTVEFEDITSMDISRIDYFGAIPGMTEDIYSNALSSLQRRISGIRFGVYQQIKKIISEEINRVKDLVSKKQHQNATIADTLSRLEQSDISDSRSSTAVLLMEEPAVFSRVDDTIRSPPDTVIPKKSNKDTKTPNIATTVTPQPNRPHIMDIDDIDIVRTPVASVNKEIVKASETDEITNPSKKTGPKSAVSIDLSMPFNIPPGVTAAENGAHVIRHFLLCATKRGQFVSFEETPDMPSTLSSLVETSQAAIDAWDSNAPRKSAIVRAAVARLRDWNNVYTKKMRQSDPNAPKRCPRNSKKKSDINTQLLISNTVSIDTNTTHTLDDKSEENHNLQHDNQEVKRHNNDDLDPNDRVVSRGKRRQESGVQVDDLDHIIGIPPLKKSKKTDKDAIDEKKNQKQKITKKSLIDEEDEEEDEDDEDEEEDEEDEEEDEEEEDEDEDDDDEDDEDKEEDEEDEDEEDDDEEDDEDDEDDDEQIASTV